MAVDLSSALVLSFGPLRTGGLGALLAQRAMSCGGFPGWWSTGKYGGHLMLKRVVDMMVKRVVHGWLRWWLPDA